MGSPEISVVIPVGGVDGFLEGQLKALLEQDLPAPFEIVLALNSSSPADARALQAVVVQLGHGRIVIVDASERRGASYARNRGAEAARGNVLIFCDADDIVRPGWLSSMSNALQGADAAGGQLVEFTTAGTLPKWRPRSTPDALPTFMNVPYAVSANFAVRRSVFESVGGFDETLTRCEDIDISWTILHGGHSLVYVPAAIVEYRVRQSMWAMLQQHYLYGIGMSEVLERWSGRDDLVPKMLRPSARWRANNQKGGLRSPVALLRKAATAIGRLVGLAQARGATARNSPGDVRVESSDD
jgi:glycosyltransferase involved in cell wall biosynthesis